MPHRAAATAIANLIEGVLFGSLALYHGAISLFSDADWEKITGPHGVAFISLLAVIVLWNQGRVNAKKEDHRRAAESNAREAQHAETLDLYERNAERLCALTAENVKAQALHTASNVELRKEISSLSGEVRALADSLEECPMLTSRRAEKQQRASTESMILEDHGV